MSLIAAATGKEDLGGIPPQMDEGILRGVALMKEMGMLVEALRHEGCNEIVVRMAY